ncbi:MAG TPA: MBL fold metallo-hydrolase [Ktedonobacterales bacterium]|jgi:phosphoribosyl 1,2-cyclic phosphodiesterase|nr:MBL fold metallo-hydrolase [Ktedonobacterales bacterium]
MRVISLASGSSGNALLVEAGSTRVLVDAGLPVRLLHGRLRQAGVRPETLTAILLTHEHHDHTCGAVALACLHNIPLVADPRTLNEVLIAPAAVRVSGTPAHDDLPVGKHKRLGALDVRSFPVSHDAAAPCGFVLTTDTWQVCVAIDTGQVSPAMARALREAHLLVIEANHDEHLLEAGPYPGHLKRRIRGATGHLSNRQTAAALAQALDGGPRWVWLAHLSRTNNTPHLARTTIHTQLQTQGHERVVLQVMPPDFGPIWESPADTAVRARQASLWSAPPPDRGHAPESGATIPREPDTAMVGNTRGAFAADVAHEDENLGDGAPPTGSHVGGAQPDIAASGPVRGT